MRNINQQNSTPPFCMVLFTRVYQNIFNAVGLNMKCEKKLHAEGVMSNRVFLIVLVRASNYTNSFMVVFVGVKWLNLFLKLSFIFLVVKWNKNKWDRKKVGTEKAYRVWVGLMCHKNWKNYDFVILKLVENRDGRKAVDLHFWNKDLENKDT